jgi:hypothetical protein
VGVSITFCPNWPQTTVLPISASRVSGITGMCYHTWLGFFFCFVLVFFVCSFFDKGSYYVAQAGPEFAVLLPQPPEYR